MLFAIIRWWRLVHNQTSDLTSCVTNVVMTSGQLVFCCSQILTQQQYKRTLIFPRFAQENTQLSPLFHTWWLNGSLFNFERRYSMKTPPEIKLYRGDAAAKKPNARRLLRVYWFATARKRDWIKKNRNNRCLKNNRAPATRIKGTQCARGANFNCEKLINLFDLGSNIRGP